MPITYSNVIFYPNSAGASGAAPTWVNTVNASGAPDSVRSHVVTTGEQTTAYLYTSGFGINIPTTANIASGIVTVVHRQASGTLNNAIVVGVIAGVGFGATALDITNNITLGATGSTFSRRSYALPASVLTPSVLNSTSFIAGVRYATESACSIDVDSIYLTIAYDVLGTPFYKTTSIMRVGSSYRYL